jgi:hypothetical protein
MSRTRRRAPREPSDPECEWDEWLRLRTIRGLHLQGSVSPPKRSGGYLCDWLHGPNAKKYYKRMTAQLRRREAKAKLRRR